MRRTTLLPATRTATLAMLGAVALGGCGLFDNIGNTKKTAPDEFKIVSHSPLTMPPNAELRPPRPGEPRPQETSTADQAREALSPTLAARNVAPDTQVPRSGDASEQALVAKAGAGGIDPNIRATVNRDTRVLDDSNKTFIDSLIFWHDPQPSGTIVDPAKEQQRLRDAQATGQPSTAPTPQIVRRQRGLLEGIF